MTNDYSLPRAMYDRGFLDGLKRAREIAVAQHNQGHPYLELGLAVQALDREIAERSKGER